MQDDGDLHPIELIAHSVLSGPLDSLNENFELLHKSQVVLLTRLKLIEQKLEQFQQIHGTIDNKPITDTIGRIKGIKKRLQEVERRLDSIDKRVDNM